VDRFPGRCARYYIFYTAMYAEQVEYPDKLVKQNLLQRSLGGSDAGGSWRVMQRIGGAGGERRCCDWRSAILYSGPPTTPTPTPTARHGTCRGPRRWSYLQLGKPIAGGKKTTILPAHHHHTTTRIHKNSSEWIEERVVIIKLEAN
jgi:hypothetical protein